MNKNYDVMFFFQITFILRITREANFAEIIKTATIFNKISLKTQLNQKNQKLCIKMQSISIFPDITKVANFYFKNDDVGRTQGVSHIIYTFFGSSLGKA